MRYPADHKAATRKRLLETAGALAKKNGYGTTGVDALMTAAGLTGGALYAHFRSKSEMLQALIDHEMHQSLERFTADTDAAFLARISSYLSLAHVEKPESGCGLPALSAEIARADDQVRETFEDLLLQIQQRLRRHLDTDEQAWAVIAQSVGAVMLARTMKSQKSRKAMLNAVLHQVEAMVTTLQASSPVASRCDCVQPQ